MFGKVLNSCGLSNFMGLEENIAEFLIKNKITVISETREDKYESLKYFRNNGVKDEYLGELPYEWHTGRQPFPYEQIIIETDRKIDGFIKELIEPISKLLAETLGNFQNKRFDVIKSACREVDSNYKFSPNWGEGI